MSVLFYHLISWSERSKIESPWSAETHHSINWTLLHESLDVILLSGVLTLHWGTPATCLLFVTLVHRVLETSDWGEGPARLLYEMAYTTCSLLQATYTARLMAVLNRHGSGCWKEKKTHLLGSWCKLNQHGKSNFPSRTVSHCPVAIALSITRVLAAVSPAERRGSSNYFFCLVFIIQLVMALRDYPAHS